MDLWLKNNIAVKDVVASFLLYEPKEQVKLINKKMDFDSVLIQDKDLTLGSKRLLSVDNTLIIPAKTTLRFIILQKM